jgi:hypothetical protein
MDFISGDLDRIFTVLYEMGRVEPLLDKDWKVLYQDSQQRWPEVSKAIDRLNVMNSLRDIRDYIKGLPTEIIDALVIEVAREMAQFYERGEVLH